MNCANHPSVETRVSCSACGKPICTDCMVFTAVGAKCADCASMPKSARIRLKPERLLLTIATGLASAIAGGLVFGLAVAQIGFFSIIFAFLLGYGVGEAVSWASGRYHASGLAAWAAGCAVLGVLFRLILMGIGNYGLSAAALEFIIASYGIWKFIWMAAAAYGAWQRNA
ncbi:MAG: B-box zinc finger protein [Thermoleophilia bacterium]